MIGTAGRLGTGVFYKMYIIAREESLQEYIVHGSRDDQFQVENRYSVDHCINVSGCLGLLSQLIDTPSHEYVAFSNQALKDISVLRLSTIGFDWPGQDLGPAASGAQS